MSLSVVKLGPDRLTLAGKHQDLLVYRHREGRVETVTNDGTWVGLLSDTAGHVSDVEVPLEPGDTVLLFTDGVTEATDASGILFGQERLEALFARLATRPLPEALEALQGEVCRYQKQQRDDVTLMLLRRLPA
jgi:serine phosphatase RsbU (regulator of sigma subunit)